MSRVIPDASRVLFGRLRETPGDVFRQDGCNYLKNNVISKVIQADIKNSYHFHDGGNLYRSVWWMQSSNELYD